MFIYHILDYVFHIDLRWAIIASGVSRQKQTGESVRWATAREVASSLQGRI